MPGDNYRWKGTLMSNSNYPCPDCSTPTPRQIIKAAAGGVAAVSLASAGIFSLSVTPRALAAEQAAKPAAETLVAQLFKSLTEAQRKVIAFPFDDKLRSKVDNNWMIVDKPISAILTKDQLALVRDIFLGIHSE